MNLDLKSENNEPKRTASIEEIISEVQDFNYNVDPTSIDKEQKESKKKGIKNLGQIRKENISKLLEIISKLNGAVESEKSSREAKIKNLYQLLRDKLGDDLYLFNVQLVAYFLQGFKRIQDIKLDVCIKNLFDIILLDIESQIIEFLPSKSETSLFFDVDKLKELLRFHAVSNNESHLSNNINFILLKFYVYLVLKNFTHSDFYRQLFKIELIFVEHISEFEQKEKNKYLLKLLPDSFLDSNPKAKVRSIVHFYFTSQIIELSGDLGTLTRKLSEIRIDNIALASQVKQLSEEGQVKDNSIVQLTKEGYEKDTNLIKLQGELKALSDRFDYEVNRADRQNQDLRSHIITQVQNNLRIELNDLNEFAKGLPPGESEILKMYLVNIKQVLNIL